MESKMNEYWKSNLIFEKSNEKREKFIFYDGPPFATGLPHYGHLLAGTIKDIVTRYWSLKGYSVDRRSGWDCHGVPIEFEIEKIHGIRSKQEIMEMGIKKYNQLCREIVLRYTDEWEKTSDKYGRWIDFKNDYKTMDVSFMSSVWYVFGELYKKNLIYQANKVMWYSIGVKTNLSNFEVSSNYQEVKENSIYISIPINETDNLLIWTTTPWTLMGNIAVGVNVNLDYHLINYQDKNYWCCNIKGLFKDHKILKTVKGIELVGLKYIPLNQLLDIKDNFELEKEKLYQIIKADYVSADSGTGLVHLAPSFGEEDFNVCLENGLINNEGLNLNDYLDEEGKINHYIKEYEGEFYRDLNEKLILRCKEKGLLFKKEKIIHSIPHCWRSDTPLIPKLIKSWYVRTTLLKERMIELNKTINWKPENIGSGRFNNWLEKMVDWNISRTRYWGTPIPLWISTTGKIKVISSKKELEDLTNIKIDDLHRDHIDELTFEIDNEIYHRIPEIFDCWFESGSMFIAQSGYPEFSDTFNFPADFIAEGIDQTRGWFYTLLVISTALFDTSPFKNVIVNGLVLAEDGKKMSKRLKNYPDANYLLDTYGGDALRMYLINSPAVKADTLRFSENGVKEIVKTFNLPLNSSINFLLIHLKLYLEKTDFKLNNNIINPMDLWISDEINQLTKFYHEKMSDYQLSNVISPLINFLDKFNNIYLKLNRHRFKNKNNDLDDCNQALTTGFKVIHRYLLLIAPITPFIAEEKYQVIKNILNNDIESIHLDDYHYPLLKSERFKVVEDIIQIIEQSRILRSNHSINLKKPLKEIKIYLDEDKIIELNKFKEYLDREINTLDINILPINDKLIKKYYFDLKILGTKCRKDTKKIIELLQNEIPNDEIHILNYHLKVNHDYNIVYQLKEPLLSNQSFLNNLLIDINLEQNEILEEIYQIRQLTSSIQHHRKLANLNPWNKITIHLDEKIKPLIDKYYNDVYQVVEMDIKYYFLQNPFYQTNLNLDFYQYNIQFDKI
jgi:isoleucyl-tRNA synthetase